MSEKKLIRVAIKIDTNAEKMLDELMSALGCTTYADMLRMFISSYYALLTITKAGSDIYEVPNDTDEAPTLLEFFPGLEETPGPDDLH